ncbi:hypothetical protein [Xanthomonas phage RTH11]|nr:hypothetical protein [Xanthomonas phage RTH11]
MVNTERERLNRRIRTLPKDKKRSLKSYRQYLTAEHNVRKRKVPMAFVPRTNKPGFFEAVDVIPLCHKFLDDLDVPADTPAPRVH